MSNPWGFYRLLMNNPLVSVDYPWNIWKALRVSFALAFGGFPSNKITLFFVKLEKTTNHEHETKTLAAKRLPSVNS